MADNESGDDLKVVKKRPKNRRRKPRVNEDIATQQAENFDDEETDSTLRSESSLDVINENVFDSITIVDYSVVTDGKPSYIPPSTFYEHTEFEKQMFSVDKGLNQAEIKSPSIRYEFINSRPTAANAKTYRLEKFQKKLLFIFNHMHVDGYKQRTGTDKDVEYLKKVFSKFNFDIKDFYDLKEHEIFEEMDKLTTEDLSDYGCIGVVVLTHGSDDGFLMAKNHGYKEGKILNYFKSDRNPSLLTKPKFLIVQACRGKKESAGIEVFSRIVSKDHTDAVEPYTIPVEADILVFHSTYYGTPSYRDEKSGSWLIQSLCQNIEEHSEDLDLERIMKLVKREIAVYNEHKVNNRRTDTIHTNKQMPVVTSTLFRDLYLRSYQGDEDDGEVVEKRNESVVDNERLEQDGEEAATSIDRCKCASIKLQYLKHNLELYRRINENDPKAESVWSTVVHLENDIRYGKSALLCDLVSPIIKEKSIICNDCKLDMRI